MTEMFDNLEGLKDREELLHELKSLLRFEDNLKKEGWYSESDFADEIKKLILELAEILKQNEWFRAPSGALINQVNSISFLWILKL